MAAQTKQTTLDFDDIEIFGIVRPPKTCKAPQVRDIAFPVSPFIQIDVFIRLPA